MSRLQYAVFAAVLSAAPAFAQPVDFNRDVRPILTDACFSCHGSDEKARKADLRLDVRDEALKAKSIVPGKPTESEIVRRILSTAKDEQMPPPKSGKKVTPAQLETLKMWIAEGAEYRGHWAFIPPKSSEIPKLATQSKNPIDAFVLSRLGKSGLTPSPRAPKETLIRRVTLDLTGLPPTLAEIDAFCADVSPNAYEKLIDRLLQTPQYGERMALDWLDAARFADTHGYHIDSGRDQTQWRDYVIRSFNENKKFDRFTVEQFAGDLLPNSTPEQKIATGFHRNHMINFEGGAIPEEYLTAYIVDRVNTMSTVWLGLTVGCAQCHDHKYDPLTMADFYKLFAFFNSVPEKGLDGSKGNAEPVMKVPSALTEKRVAELKKRLAEVEAKLAGPLPEVDASQATWEKNPQTQKTTWKPVAPTKLKSKGGASLKVLDDKTIRAEGTNPATETYTVSFPATSGKVTALRLEVFADAAFPARGPGRSANGNFVLTGVKVAVEGSAKPVAIKTATADYSQKDGNFEVASSLVSGKGWAIHPEVGKDHWSVFEFAEPLDAAGKELTVTFSFNSVFPQHQFGKFRLATTDSATPHEAAGTPAAISEILGIEKTKRLAKQVAELKSYYRTSVSSSTRTSQAEIAGIRKEIADAEKATPTAMVMSEMAKPRDTFMLLRGQYDKKGEKVSAGTPAALPPMAKGAPVNRLGLANWIVAPENPLTARVTVNRYWQMLFGVGLVKTAEDFGTQGEYPSHPELLDWLAADFVRTGWDVKHLIRQMVSSETYCQTSRVSAEQLAKDPENRLLGRTSRVRLPAEFLRDQALAVSGLLNGEIGGKSVSPYQPSGIWEELAFRLDNKNWTAQTYEQSHGKDLYRRGMYTFWKRTAPPPSMVTLDAPDREVCTVRRSRTNTPLQALILMNDPTYVEAARKFAERILVEGGKATPERLTFLVRTALSRLPSERERELLGKLRDSQLAKFRANPAAAKKLLSVGESPRNESLDPAELAAWTMVATTVLNLDETLTRN